jgi:hypothetical protein
MITAITRIAPLGVSDPIGSEQLRAYVDAVLAVDDRVEHLRVRSEPRSGYADVFAFLDLDDPEIADEVLRRVVRRAIVATPPLRLWRVL